MQLYNKMNLHPNETIEMKIKTNFQYDLAVKSKKIHKKWDFEKVNQKKIPFLEKSKSRINIET